MRILLLLSILILVNQDSRASELSRSKNLQFSETFGDLYATTMQIWTQLDLLSAIRTSQEDLQYFGSELVDKLLVLRQLILEHHQDHNEQQLHELPYLCSIVHQISDRFEAVFATGYSKEIFCAKVLLERILSLLEEKL